MSRSSRPRPRPVVAGVRMARKRKKIGEILLEWKVVTAEQVDQAKQIADRTGKRIGEALVEAGACDEEAIAKALAAQYDKEFINLDRPEANSRIDMTLIPDNLIKKHLVLPMGK